MRKIRKEGLCLHCFNEIGIATQCPQCGGVIDEEHENPDILKAGTILDDKYIVGHALGLPGGFGIAYIGYDVFLKRKVAIKEYFPKGVVIREHNGSYVHVSNVSAFEKGMRKFEDEARILGQFRHFNIPSGHNFFMENGTGYLIMEYVDGMTLESYMKHYMLNEKHLVQIILPVVDALYEVHSKGYLHLDIKPGNIMVGTLGHPALIDFGSAVHKEDEYHEGVIYTKGFAAPEQYIQDAYFDESTDIYSIGSTLFYALTGEKPTVVKESGAENSVDSLLERITIHPKLSKIVSKCLNFEMSERYTSTLELQGDLYDLYELFQSMDEEGQTEKKIGRLRRIINKGKEKFNLQ